LYKRLPDGFKQTLNKLGINETNISQAWKALPSAIDLEQHLTAKPPDLQAAFKDINAIGTAAPDLLKSMSTPLYNRLPDSVQQKLTDMGITSQNVSQAWAAMPHVLAAAEALGKGEAGLPDALNELGEIGKAAPDLLGSIGKRIYEKLPASV